MRGQKTLIFLCFLNVFAFRGLPGAISAQHRLLGRLGIVLESSWTRLGAILGPSWGVLWSSWGVLWPSCGRVGHVLGPSWGVLAASWAVLWRLGAALASQNPPKNDPKSIPKSIKKSIENRCHLGPPWGAKNLIKPMKKQDFL